MIFWGKSDFILETATSFSKNLELPLSVEKHIGYISIDKIFVFITYLTNWIVTSLFCEYV